MTSRLNQHVEVDLNKYIDKATEKVIKTIPIDSMVYFSDGSHKYTNVPILEGTTKNFLPISWDRISSIIKIELRDNHEPRGHESMYGGAKVKHCGRMYKVHQGKRGGKYILVGSDKKKVYV